jgi:processive 1,2-diacylglycerol beta-glucosyltransferase
MNRETGSAARGPRVLILSASYGSGHNRVAGALAREFRRAGARPLVVDHFRTLVNPRFDAVSQRLYALVLRRAPALWRMAYWLSDRLDADSPLLLGMNRPGAAGLRRLLRRVAPDHVVAVHPTPGAVLSALATRGEGPPPLTAVLTDFAPHGQWLFPRVARYCVPAEEVGAGLVARGAPAERIVVTGIPVRPEFGLARDRAAARRQLDLAPGRPVLLVMAGSAGNLGGLEEATRTLLTFEEVQIVVVAGRDQEMHSRLRVLAASEPARLRVLGYVDCVRDLMAAADLIVTKAGAVTLAEAWAAELPVLCFRALPGHEERNERFAVRADLAFRAGSGAELATTVASLLRDPRLLERTRERIRLRRRPDAARRVVDVVLERQLMVQDRVS